MNDKKGISMERLMELSRAFQGSRILLSAFELDIFTVIGDGEKSSVEIARETGADPRGMNRLLNACCALELLFKTDEKFSNSPVTARFLVKGQGNYLAGMMHTVHLWDSWSTLTDAVRNGGLVRQHPVDERDDTWFEAFIAAMHGRAANEAPHLVDALDLTGVSRVLDVGGGSGAFSMAFVRAADNITATVFDLSTVVPLTRKYVEKEGLDDRIDTVTGDYNKDDLPTGYDLAFLSAIIHSNSPEQNRHLFRKVEKALNPGGKIVVSDFIMDEDRTNPPFGAFFALNMLVNTPGGDTYTADEIKSWMEKAGLSFVERKGGIMIGSKA